MTECYLIRQFLDTSLDSKKGQESGGLELLSSRSTGLPASTSTSTTSCWSFGIPRIHRITFWHHHPDIRMTIFPRSSERLERLLTGCSALALLRVFQMHPLTTWCLL